MAIRYRILVAQHRTGKPMKRIVVTFLDLTTNKRTNVVTDLDGLATAVLDNVSRVIVHTTQEYELINLSAGAGPCYDYIISPTKDEGTHQSLGAAIADANVNRQSLGQDSTFFVCRGGYTEPNTISLNPPQNGSYVVQGAGREAVDINGTMTSGQLLDVPTQVGTSIVDLSGIGLRTNDSITLIRGGGSTRIGINTCFLRNSDSSSIALDPGIAGRGMFVEGTYIEGSGLGVAAAGGTTDVHTGFRMTGGYIACRRGVEIDIDGFLNLSNVHLNCSEEDVFIQNGINLFLNFPGCTFNQGIVFEDNFLIQTRMIIINGATFFECFRAIDFSGCTGDLGASTIFGLNVTGSNFYTTNPNAIGILGENQGPVASVVKANAFYGYTPGNEIQNMNHAGNKIGNNATDSGATLPTTDEEAIAAVPFAIYIPFGTEPITGQSYAP